MMEVAVFFMSELTKLGYFRDDDAAQRQPCAFRSSLDSEKENRENILRLAPRSALVSPLAAMVMAMICAHAGRDLGEIELR